MADIFISYSSRGRAAARSLAQELRTSGFESLFLDIDVETGIAPGADWKNVPLRKAKAKPRCNCAVLSQLA